MLTVTNAFNPHLLTFPLRPDLSKHQHHGNLGNTHTMTVPVVQPSQKYIPASFSTISQTTAAAVPRQTHLSSTHAAHLALHTSTIPAATVFTSPATAPSHQGFESRYLAPGVSSVPTLPQNVIGIHPVLHGHYSSCASTHVNYETYRQVDLKMTSMDDSYLYRGCVKPPGAGMSTIRPSGNPCDFGYMADNGLSPMLACTHPQMIRNDHPPEPIATRDSCKTGDNVATHSLKEFPDDANVIYPKGHKNQENSPGENSWRPISASLNAVSSSHQSMLSIGSPLQSKPSTTPTSKTLLSSKSPSPDKPKLQNLPKREPVCIENTTEQSTSPEVNAKQRKRRQSENRNEEAVAKSLKREAHTDCSDTESRELTRDDIALVTTRTQGPVNAAGRLQESRDIHSQNREIHSQNGEIHSQNGEIHSQNGEIHSQNGEISSTTSFEITVSEPQVKSLRHSIESILSMSRVMRDHDTKMQNKDAQGKRKEDGYETIDQNDEENVGNNRWHEQHTENVCEWVKDDDDDDSDVISIVSTETNNDNDDSNDEKEIVDIDIMSLDEICHHASVPSPNDRLEITDDNSGVNDNYYSPLTHYDEKDDTQYTSDFNSSTENDQLSPEALSVERQINDSFKIKNNFEDPPKTSSIYINEHLKKLQGLLSKNDHFQKDEFFQAKLQILRSVSKNCKLVTGACEHTVTQQLGQSDHADTTQSDPNGCTFMTPMSTSPPFQSMLPACDAKDINHQWPTFSLPDQNSHHFSQPTQYRLPPPQQQSREHQNGSQTVEQPPNDSENVQRHRSDVLDENSQRSAFKPIIKKTMPSHFIPAHLAHHANSSAGILHTFPTRPPIPQPSIGLSAGPFASSNEGVKISEAIPNVPTDNHSLDESVNLDAISLLRLRSGGYPCPSSSLPSSFAYSSNARPNPEAMSLWLTWLRNRNPAALRTIPIQTMHSVLPKSSAPPPRYHCGDCNKTYSTFGGLSKHRQFHCSLHVKKEFACKICTKSYSSLGALKMHIRTHTLPCKCHICGKAFSRPWLLQGHVRTHTGEKPFRCNHCGRAFADRSNLRAHLQTHAEIKKYACVKCGKTFSRMSLLTKHSDGSCPAHASQCI